MEITIYSKNVVPTENYFFPSRNFKVKNGFGVHKILIFG